MKYLKLFEIFRDIDPSTPEEFNFYPGFEELDIVVSTVQIDEIPPGTEGTIVHVHDDDMYEVEFFEDGNTLAVKTVSGEQIKER